MADTATAAPEAAPPAVVAKPEERIAAPAEPTKVDEPAAAEPPKEEPAAAPKPAEPEQKPADAAPEPATETKKDEEAPAVADAVAPAADGDTEMKDAAAEVTSAKSTNANRRKSGAGAAKGGNKKGKAKATHIDAKPGDHFLVKLKGFPLWPVIICDEEMLPETLLRTRPVSAARPDGTYGDAYAEGGKRTYDRNFAVMYLATYEFGWVSNQALTELSSEKAKSSINEKQRKDLREAYELAVEQHPVQHYKDLIQKIEDERQAFLAAQEAARAEAAATPKKSKKAKEDTEMTDADGKKSKKRKADDEAALTPQRSDSAKKPKIKLTSSASKATNGAAKPKEDAPKKKTEKKEVKLSPEEQRKALEERISWLRYKLQKGLLTGPIEEGAIRGLSDYLKRLETFTDLEASLLKKTKIHKVLKGIIKLETIPLEDELQMKPRSRALLDLWNKALAAAAAAAPATDTSTTDKVNGTNGSAEPDDTPKPEESKVTTDEAPKEEAKDEVKPSIEDAPKEEEKPAAEAPVATTE